VAFRRPAASRGTTMSRGLVGTILVGALIVAGIAVVAISIGLAYLDDPGLQEKQLYFDLYRSVGIGFVVALLGALIPHLLTEARDEFEREKESREAYSKAKTAILYLPGTLATRGYGEASRTLREAHQLLHKAETYPQHLDRYLSEWYGDSETWRSQSYWELTAVRLLLQSHASDWSGYTENQRTQFVERDLQWIRDFFGHKGSNWKDLDEDQRDRSEEGLQNEVRTRNGWGAESR